MNVPCPTCGHSFAVADTDLERLAGQYLSCPRCGTSKRLPTDRAGASRADKTNDPSARSKPASRRPAWLLPAVVVFGLLLIVSVAFGVRSLAMSSPSSMGPVVNALLSDEERAKGAVREHLRKSLPSGEWEEIEWFGYGPAKGCRVFTITNNHPLIDLRNRGDKECYSEVVHKGHCLRLRLRTQSDAGAKEIRDWTFLIDESASVRTAVPSLDVLLPDEGPDGMVTRLRDSPELSGVLRDQQDRRKGLKAARNFLKADLRVPDDEQ